MDLRLRFLTIFRLQGVFTLCMAASSSTWAQQATTEVIITAEPPIGFSELGGVPLQALPLNISVIGNATLHDIGAQRVSDALRLDASVSDSYNLPVYWDQLSVRGFALDNSYNYRREGLPISVETIIAMDNKERIELLKGTSGIQSGTSAPGGLVNYVVKRPPTNVEKNIRDVTLSYGPGDNRLVAVDLGGRFGEGADFGYRFNLAHEDLNPYIRDTKGYRDLVAFAMDWRINSSNRLEWEFEQSHHEQIGVNFYSLWGPGTNALPPLVDGTRNITRQPSSQPSVFDGLTGSVRLKHQLDSGWLWTTQYGTQRLHSDDRLTYASGCADGPGDRFCTNGNFQIHDFRSDNEHRKNEAIQTSLHGQLYFGNLEHNLSLGLMRQRRFNQLPYAATESLLGSTNSITGGLIPPSGATNYWPNTDISDYSTELSINDRVRLTHQTTAWFGIRHTQLDRQSIQTNGDAGVHDNRGISTPWLALSHELNHHYTVYASYGQGLEADVVPNLTNTSAPTSFTNAGQPLPILRSTQREVGIKNQHERTTWQATWFDITRPATADAKISCDSGTPQACIYTRQIDGVAHHQGLELSAQTKLAQWDFAGSAMRLNATRENATIDPSTNGQHPINVPKYILRGMAQYHYANVVGLRSGLRISHEAERNVTENGDIMLPAWTTLDATTHYDTKINNTSSTWSIAINNVADKRYWRESPKAHGQYFLYPGAPRTVRATVQLHL